MAKRRRKYTKQFKLDAVPLVLAQGRTVADVARSLGIPEGLLSQWKMNVAKLSAEAFPGNGKRTAHDDEIWQLQKKLGGCFYSLRLRPVDLVPMAFPPQDPAGTSTMVYAAALTVPRAYPGSLEGSYTDAARTF